MVEGIETPRAQLLDSVVCQRNSSVLTSMVREAYFQRHDFIANGDRSSRKRANAKAIQGELDDASTHAVITGRYANENPHQAIGLYRRQATGIKRFIAL